MFFVIIQLIFAADVDFRRSIIFSQISNITFTSHNLISSKYNNHPLILGLPHLDYGTLTLRSMRFDGMISPLFEGKNVLLRLVDVDFYNFYNQTLHFQDKLIIDRSTVGLSSISIDSCTFQTSVSTWAQISGGSLFLRSSTLSVNHSLFFNCNANEGAAIYANESQIALANTNFTSCFALSRGVTLFTQSATSITHCIYYNCFSKRDTICSIVGKTYILNCGFVSNTHEMPSCVYFDSCVGIIRNTDFLYNLCGSIESNPNQTHPSMIFINNPKRINIINCQFNGNILGSKENEETSIAVSGSGLARIIFCKFDKDLKNSIVKLNEGQDLTAVVKNCRQDLAIKSIYQNIANEMNFDKEFKYDFEEFFSFDFLFISVAAVILLFVVAIAILYFV